MSSIGELATFYPVSGSLVHTLPDLLIRHLVLQWVGCIGYVVTCNKCRYHCCFQCITILGCI